MHSPIIFIINPQGDDHNIALVGNKFLGKVYLYGPFGVYFDSYSMKYFLVEESRKPHWIAGEAWQLNHSRQWKVLYHTQNPNSEAMVSPLMVWRHPALNLEPQKDPLLANGFIYPNLPSKKHLTKIRPSGEGQKFARFKKTAQPPQKFMASTLH